jgi:hypothetical protein
MILSVCIKTMELDAYNSSRRYGAEDQEAFSPTFMEGLAEAHNE